MCIDFEHVLFTFKLWCFHTRELHMVSKWLRQKHGPTPTTPSGSTGASHGGSGSADPYTTLQPRKRVLHVLAVVGRMDPQENWEKWFVLNLFLTHTCLHYLSLAPPKVSMGVASFGIILISHNIQWSMDHPTNLRSWLSLLAQYDPNHLSNGSAHCISIHPDVNQARRSRTKHSMAGYVFGWIGRLCRPKTHTCWLTTK